MVRCDWRDAIVQWISHDDLQQNAFLIDDIVRFGSRLIRFILHGDCLVVMEERHQTGRSI